MTGKLRDLTVNRDGTQNIVITVPEDFTKTYDALKDKPVTVEIKKASKARSKDANAMCWALCTAIGNAMTPPEDKAEIYRSAIKAVGVYTQVRLAIWDVPTVTNRWTDHGTGWFAEVVDDAGIGHKWVNLYYGSSTYTTDEMRVLIDWLLDQTQQTGVIVPLTKKEEEELLERWGRR